MTWLKENKLFYGVILILIVVFVVGGFYSDYVIKHRAEEIIVDEERYYNEVTLVNLEYNFDKETLGHKTYIATFTYDGSTYKSFVDHTFCFVELIEGESLELMVHSAVKHHAEQEAILQNIAYISSFNETTKTLVITADGFAGSGSISVEFTLNDALDGISAYTVTSTESYKSDYNEDYIDGAVPFVENNMMDQYVAGHATIDTVAGASEGTGDAMIELISLLDLFFDSMEGGN